MTYIYDHNGRRRKIEHIRAVERLEKLKEKHGADPWPVIEECLKIWANSEPTTWQSYLIRLEDIRNTRRDREYATSGKDPVHGGILRYTLDIPEKVMYMIRTLYTPEELPMDRNFFQAFGRKFPRFKIAEKL